jgi:alkanesulfonate monooxygenase SsuD/methylene tetrahydromethanopterin reductase-like flavin-dependent oxidoreductase (luciferase family)
VPLRNPALAAMEIASVARMFPGRAHIGFGHGILDWMGQVGARAESPMTLLREYTTALRALLHGETVTTSGRYVHLDGVALDWPPSAPPPLLVGAMGDKTTALAGELSDGVIFSDTTADRVRQAMEHLRAGRRTAGREGVGDVVVFLAVEGALDASAVADGVHEMVAAGATHVALYVRDSTVPLEDAAHFVVHELQPRVDGL